MDVEFIQENSDNSSTCENYNGEPFEYYYGEYEDKNEENLSSSFNLLKLYNNININDLNKIDITYLFKRIINIDDNYGNCFFNYDEDDCELTICFDEYNILYGNYNNDLFKIYYNHILNSIDIYTIENLSIRDVSNKYIYSHSIVCISPFVNIFGGKFSDYTHINTIYNDTYENLNFVFDLINFLNINIDRFITKNKLIKLHSQIICRKYLIEDIAMTINKFII